MAARDAFRERAKSIAEVITEQVITYLPMFLYRVVCCRFLILTE